MIEVIAAGSADVEEFEDAPAPTEPEARSSARESVLDRIRQGAEAAREELWVDVPLSDRVPGPLGLRLGIPRTVFATAASDWEGSVDAEQAIRDLASNVLAVVEPGTLPNGEPGWVPVEGLTVEDIAMAYGTVLRGNEPVFAGDASEVRAQAIRELYLSGKPPQLEPHKVVATARMYREWALDPTSARF